MMWLGYVSWTLRSIISLHLATPNLTVVIMEESELLPKSLVVDIIGHYFIRMPLSGKNHVTSVKCKVVFQEYLKCLWNKTSRLSAYICGVLSLWAYLWAYLETNKYFLQIIILLNWWKPWNFQIMKAKAWLSFW